MPEPNECLHENRGYCWRTYSNGSEHFGTQCLRCGEWCTIPKKDKQNIHPSAFDAPAYDPEIRRLWFERKRDEFRAARESSSVSFHERMQSYYRSDEWRRKRDRRLKFNREYFDGLCEVCFSRDATDCHHVSYARFEAEWVFDLAAVCSHCHELFHTEETGDAQLA